MLALIRRWKIDSFAAFLLVYTAQFSIIFAGAMSNFGLLARQRVMLMPFAIMMLTASLAERKHSEEALPAYPYPAIFSLQQKKQ